LPILPWTYHAIAAILAGTTPKWQQLARSRYKISFALSGDREADKEYILSEIKCTAAANGGKPPGRSRFSQETGIKESDWIGKFWARWGDAVREAGFEPNQLQTAYGDDILTDREIHWSCA